MNTRLLANLVEEYHKSSGITTEETEFLIQTGKELEISEPAVRSLIAIYRDGLAEKPADKPRQALDYLYQLAEQLSNSPERQQFLTELGQTLGFTPHAVNALIAFQQARAARDTSPTVLAELVAALGGGRPLSEPIQAFIAARAAEMNIPEATVRTLQALEQAPVAPDSHPLTLLYELIRERFTKVPLPEAERAFILTQASRSGLPAEVAESLVALHQVSLALSADTYPPDYLDRLVATMVRASLTADRDLALLSRLADAFHIPANALTVILRLERAIQSNNVAEARLLLTNLTQVLSDGSGQLPVAGSAFMMRKYTEVSGAEKVAEAADLLKKKLSERSTGASAPAATAAKPATVPASKPAAPEKPLKVGLNESQVFEVDDQVFAVKESALQSHPAGFNWFLHLGVREGGSPDQVVINGQVFPAAEVEEITFSRAGDGYAFRHKKAGKENVMLRGQQVEQFDLAGGLTFSANGAHFCCIGRKGKAWHLLADSTLHEGRAGYREPSYNPVTHKLAYYVFENQRWHWVNDGLRGEGYVASSGTTYSPDGTGVALWVRQGQSVHVVHNGKIGPAFEGLADLTFGSQGTHLAYLANQHGKVVAVNNGKAGPGFDSIRRLGFSPMKNSLCYVGNTDGLEHLVLDQQLVAAYDRVFAIAFSPDGEDVATIVQKGRRKRVVHNSEDQTAYEEVSRLCFSPTSRSYAYQALNRDRVWMVVQDGVESEPYVDIDDLSFSPDGRRLAFLGRVKGQGVALTVNGEREKEVQMAKNLVWSTDSKAIAYLLFDRGGWFVCVNGHVANKQPYHEVYQPLRYDEARDCFYTLVRQGNAVITVAYH